MYLDQNRLIKKILTETGMNDSKPIDSPVITSLEGGKDDKLSTINDVERSQYHSNFKELITPGHKNSSGATHCGKCPWLTC